MLKLTNITAKLDKKIILQGVNLSVNTGEVHVLLGPNGSGKSTLGRVILGDDRYESEGEIVINGEDMSDAEPDERARAGYFLAFQTPPELDGVSAKELLIAAKKAQNDGEVVSHFKFQKKLSAQVSAMGLAEEFVDRPVNKGASGGERRKMEMVQLLTTSATVAFLDEIDSGIDVDAMQAIAKGIQEFLARGNTSVIIVSHTEKLLEMLPVTHVHVLSKGEIVHTGGAEVIDTVHKNGFAAYMKTAGLSVIQ